MFNLFKKKTGEENQNEHLSLISVTALLIHSAKLDENFTKKEKLIIKSALIEMGADKEKIDELAQSIKKNALIQPLIVTRRNNDTFLFLQR